MELNIFITNNLLFYLQKRDILLDAIDTYIRDQIEKAAQAISISVQEKIADGDVILTYGWFVIFSDESKFVLKYFNFLSVRPS